MLCLLRIVPPIIHRYLLLCIILINIWRNIQRLRSIDIKCICFLYHIFFLSHMRFVKFRMSAEVRLERMFENSFGLPNLLDKTNKPGLLPVLQNSVNMLSFDGVFCYEKHNIFHEIIEYCRIRSNDSQYVIFS